MAMTLDVLRVKIDTIDDEILALLESRAQLMTSVARAKSEARAGLPKRDPKRERQVLERLTSRATHFPRESLRAVFREVISACLALQEPQAGVFLGPDWSFARDAAHQALGRAARLRAEPNLDDLCLAVIRGEARYGIVPAERSDTGPVGATFDALFKHDVHVCEEVLAHEAHGLFSHAPDLATIERVYAAPNAAERCRGWLAQRLGRAVVQPCASAREAAQRAAAEPTSAVISCSAAADSFGLPALHEGVDDAPPGRTRYFVISAEDYASSGTQFRTLLCFVPPPDRGARARTFEALACLEPDPSRLLSRPHPSQPRQHVYFSDVRGHHAGGNVQRVLERIAHECEVRVVGTYSCESPPQPQARAL
jgi:chorismate mutase/prephenate dehydratase